MTGPILILCALVGLLAASLLWTFLFDQPLDSFSHEKPTRKRRYGNGV